MTVEQFYLNAFYKKRNRKNGLDFLRKLYKESKFPIRNHFILDYS